MLKRVLHAANQVITHPEKYIGRELTINGTVNDKVDFLKITGDSWQLQQEEIKDTDGNVIQPAMPSPEHPSEIHSVSGEAVSCGWNYIGKNVDWIKGTYLYYQIPANDFTLLLLDNDKDADISGVYLALTVTGDYGTPGNTVTWLINNGNLRMTELNNKKERYKYIAIFTATQEILDKLFRRFKLMIFSGERLPYDRYRGSTINTPELRAIRDNAGNIVAEDILWVDRTQKKAYVERNIGMKVFDGTEKIKKYDNGLYFELRHNT